MLDDIPPPVLPTQIATRDDLNAITIELAGWGAALRTRLNEIRAWSTQQ